MRKIKNIGSWLLLFALLAALLAALAFGFSANDDAVINGKWKFEQLIVMSGGTTLSGANTISGATTISGAQTVTGSVIGSITHYTQASTPVTLTSTACGKAYGNKGATGTLVYNLPEASTVVGCRITFTTYAAQTIGVNPGDADQILALTNAAGDSITNATAGNSVTLLATDDTNWIAVAIYGTWADGN